MVRTRERKRTEEQGSGWVIRMVELLRGGALGVGVALAVLLAAAALISGGILGGWHQDSVVIAACLAGGVSGGLLAVRRTGSGPLPMGLAAGTVLFLLLLSAGALLGDTMPSLRPAFGVACACLCGGGLAGILGSKPKKKRRK